MEIPRTDQERRLIFLEQNRRYTLIDDFVPEEGAIIDSMRLDSGKLVYGLRAGKLPLVRTPLPPPSGEKSY